MSKNQSRHRDLINKVFEDYYYSNLIPSTFGGFDGSTSVQLLAAINVLYETNLKNTAVNKVWYDDKTVTWYTPQLNKLISLPRFSDDSDQDFLDRVKDFHEAQTFGGQSEESIRTVLTGLMSEAIQKSNITFFFQGSASDLWDGSAFWDGTAAWQDLDTVLDVQFLVSIQFPISGFPVDRFAWEYWNLEANMTKISDLISLFKPVGATFKIQLVAPSAFRRYFLSSTRLKVLANETTQTSSIAIKIVGFDDKMMASDTSIFKAGFFFGDLEFNQTLNITSVTNIEDAGNTDVTYTKLYGSGATIVAP